MGSRRKSRECALQMLFQRDFQSCALQDVFAHYWEDHQVSDEVQAFAEKLVEGVFRNHQEIDDLIKQHSTNWRLDRMPTVDRNILRIATYELLFEHEIASRVSLNEAIEIAKRYGAVDSGAFINGVLDPIAKALEG